MERKYEIIIYGSYGYTGRLIAEECKKHKLSILLSGRNEDKLVKQSQETGYPYKTVAIQDGPKLHGLLEQGKLVIHCGGPFIHTAEIMINACLHTKTHYTDITGEYPVFELLAGYHEKAVEKGILIMPGVGFDVVPSDCLAVHLKEQMPDATHLELALAMTKVGMSRGTNKTMTENLGYPAMIRKDGKLTPVPMGSQVKEIDFGPFSMKTMCIPWGDISTAWRSTGIDNIQVNMAVPEKMIRSARMSRSLGWLLRMKWVKNYMLKQIDKKKPGPSKAMREKGRSLLYGKVKNNQGNEIEARLEVPNGYTLTADAAVYIAQQILNTVVRMGYSTPASYFGKDLIIDIGGSHYY